MNGRCVNCDHWRYEIGPSNKQQGPMGTCERFPPVRDMDVRMGADGVNGEEVDESAADDWYAWKQPLTQGSAGCGEFRQRADDGEVPA